MDAAKLFFRCPILKFLTLLFQHPLIFQPHPDYFIIILNITPNSEGVILKKAFFSAQ
jgi:hypothetical protein